MLLPAQALGGTEAEGRVVGESGHSVPRTEAQAQVGRLPATMTALFLAPELWEPGRREACPTHLAWKPVTQDRMYRVRSRGRKGFGSMGGGRGPSGWKP